MSASGEQGITVSASSLAENIITSTEHMNKPFRMLIKSVDVKTLVSGDKELKLILMSSTPLDIPELTKLTTEYEVDVTFDLLQD